MSHFRESAPFKDRTPRRYSLPDGEALVTAIDVLYEELRTLIVEMPFFPHPSFSVPKNTGGWKIIFFSLVKTLKT